VRVVVVETPGLEEMARPAGPAASEGKR